MNGLGRVHDIARVQAGHADAAILRHVDVRILAQLQDLGLGQAGEAEHADLVRDVLPRVRAAVEFLEQGAQRGAHVLDAAAHGAQVVLPLGEEGRVVEDGAGDAGAVRGRVADLGALQDGQLRGDAVDGRARVRAGARDEVEGARALAVEAEVLGERLRHAELEAVRDEVAHRPGVVLQVSRREPLVGAVEEGEVLLGADRVRELDPLLVREVDAGRVVRACVQEEDAPLRGFLDGRHHAGEIEAFGLGREIGVGFDGQVHVGEDLVVVGPCWGGEVDRLVGWARVEFGEEQSAQVDGART